MTPSSGSAALAPIARVPQIGGLDIGEPVRTVELPDEEPFKLPASEPEPARRDREAEPQPAPPGR